MLTIKCNTSFSIVVSKKRREAEINSLNNNERITLGRRAAPASDSEARGDGHQHFEDGHEAGDFTEVTGADDLSVDLQAALVVLPGDAPADLVETVQDVRGERLISELVVQRSQSFGCIIKLPLGLWVSCCELASLNQAVEGGLQH